MQKKSNDRKNIRKKLFSKAALVFFLLGVFLLHIPSGYAQEAGSVVRGVVIDETGETIPGVYITVKGSTREVATDLDGSFSIDAKSKDVLIMTFLGYQDLEVQVGSQKQISRYNIR